MTTIRRTLLIVAAAAMATTLASATSITNCVALSCTTTQTLFTPSTVTGWNASYTFNKFNTTIGTLGSISLELIDTLSGNVTVTNSSGSSGLYNAILQTEDWFSLNSALIAQNPAGFNSTWTDTSMSVFTDDFDSKSTSTFTLANGASATNHLSGNDTFGGEDPETGGDFTLGSATLLDSQFSTAGNGSLTIYELAAGSSGYVGNSPSSASGIPNNGSEFILTYNYQAFPAVPEPTTLVLAGAGLIGLAVARRKARS